MTKKKKRQFMNTLIKGFLLYVVIQCLNVAVSTQSDIADLRNKMSKQSSYAASSTVKDSVFYDNLNEVSDTLGVSVLIGAKEFKDKASGLVDEITTACQPLVDADIKTYVLLGDNKGLDDESFYDGAQVKYSQEFASNIGADKDFLVITLLHNKERSYIDIGTYGDYGDIWSVDLRSTFWQGAARTYGTDFKELLVVKGLLSEVASRMANSYEEPGFEIPIPLRMIALCFFQGVLVAIAVVSVLYIFCDPKKEVADIHYFDTASDGIVGREDIYTHTTTHTYKKQSSSSGGGGGSSSSGGSSGGGGGGGGSHSGGGF